MEIERTPVTSSNIASVGYSAEDEVLEIEFQSGDVWQYSSVPSSVYYALMSAPSVGSFFHHHVRNVYSGERA